MTVDRQQRVAEREQQQDRRRLLPDAIDLGQPAARVKRGHLAKELERVVAPFLADPAERRLDPGRLLVAEAADPDGLDQLGEWRELDRAPIWRHPVGQSLAAPAGARVVRLDLADARVARPQSLERRLCTRVGAVLGQDRQDQLACRVEAALPGRAPVQRRQSIEHERYQPWPVPLEGLRPCPPRVRELALAGPALDGLRGRCAHGPNPTDTILANRSPHRSNGAGPLAIASSIDMGRSTTGTATAPTDASASMPAGSTPPPTARHGTPAAAARLATPSAVFPNAV